MIPPPAPACRRQAHMPTVNQSQYLLRACAAAARLLDTASRREAQVVWMIPPPVFQGGARRHRQRGRLTPVALEHAARIRVATGGFAFGEPKQVVG